MRNLILSCIISLLIMTSQANAASFSLIAHDDAVWNSSTENLLNSSLLNAGSFSTFNNLSLLKFEATPAMISSLQNEDIISLKLKLYTTTTAGNPNVKIFWKPDDNWNENQGTMSAPVYDSTSLGMVDTSSTGFTITNLNLSQDLDPDVDNPNIVSFVLKNINSNSSAYFASNEYSDYYAPKLTLLSCL